MEFREGDSVDCSAHTPMYNPHILPLILLTIKDIWLSNLFLTYFMLKNRNIALKNKYRLYKQPVKKEM